MNASLPHPVSKNENEHYRQAFDAINATGYVAVDSCLGVVEMKEDTSWNPFPSENNVNVICEQDITLSECTDTDKIRKSRASGASNACGDVLEVKGYYPVNGLYNIKTYTVNGKPAYYNAKKKLYLFSNFGNGNWHVDDSYYKTYAPKAWAYSYPCPTDRKYYTFINNNWQFVSSISVKKTKGTNLSVFN